MMTSYMFLINIPVILQQCIDWFQEHSKMEAANIRYYYATIKIQDVAKHH